MEVAITGAAGFIGRRLVARHLERGDGVRVLSRSENRDFPSGVQRFVGDLTRSTEVLSDFVKYVDVLYHCAGEVNDRAKMHDAHVRGTENLAQEAMGKIGRWVQLSSVGVYGQLKDSVVDEQRACRPVGVYEETKATSDEIVWKFFQDKAFELCILRPSNVYGPDMSHRYIFQMIRMIERGIFFYIGNKQASKMSNIHVDNVIDALVLCGTSPKANGQIFNLSDEISLQAYVSVITRALNRRQRFPTIPEFLIRFAARIFDQVPGSPLTTQRVNAMTSRVSYSSVNIKNTLGYSHRIPLEKGLQELVKCHQNRIRTGK